jgi:sulfite reductase alpha subunit-like flavoprotein
LISLSETSNAALYGDCILRKKRNWGDVLFEFDSIKLEVDRVSRNELKDLSPFFVQLTIEHLLMILSTMMPRHFSIATAPSLMTNGDNNAARGYSLRNGRFGFNLELCIAIVRGKLGMVAHP